MSIRASNISIGTLVLRIHDECREFSYPVSQSGMVIMMYSAIGYVVRSKSSLTEVELVSVNRSSIRIHARIPSALVLGEVPDGCINQE